MFYFVIYNLLKLWKDVLHLLLIFLIIFIFQNYACITEFAYA